MSVFIDTNAWLASLDARERLHGAAQAFAASARSDRSLRPLFTSDYIVDELVTLSLARYGRDAATRTLSEVLDGRARILHVTPEDFQTAVDSFRAMPRGRISFTDHTTSVLCRRHGIDAIFTFDSDFEALGHEVVPRRGRAE